VTTAGVLLAAGAGTRFRGETHKLLARLGDRTVFEQALGTLLDAGFDQVVVVTGAADLDPLLTGRPVERVLNHEWERGIATSLRAAWTSARYDGHDAIVVGLADQPGVTVDAWRAVAAESRTTIAVATYDGTRGNPVRLAKEVWSLLPEEGDEGARVLMRDRPELVTEVPCSGTPFDIDTTEDLRHLGGTP
jgi:CTP:molybdopterin cytidylyltransferase MocA